VAMTDKAARSNSAPGWKMYPNHRVTTKPAQVRVRVTFKGEVMADTRNAIQMEEGMEGSTVAPIVYYIPRQDVKMDRLARTQHRTYCPFKGSASYFSIVGGPENAVWSYERPYDEMAGIKDLVAFYPDKVDAIEASRE
jgi:uncharacterized protein (DUF427 family)